MTYYIFVNGQQTGPLTYEQLQQYNIQPDTKVWREGLADWVSARELDDLKDLLAKTSFAAWSATTQPETYRPASNFDSAGFLAKLDRDYQWMIGSMIALLAGFVLLMMATGWAAFDDREIDENSQFVFFVLIAALVVLAAVVLSIVFFCKVQYAYWTIVQGGNGIPKPGEAVGFLFIPFFNFYWIFVSFNRLSKELNRVADERDPGGYPRADEGVSMAYCILHLCSIIPFLGYLASLGSLILFFIMMANHKKVVYRIVNAQAFSF